MTPEEKVGTFLSSAIASSMALSIRLLQFNTLGHETYKVCKHQKPKVHMATQTEPKSKETLTLAIVVSELSLNVKSNM